MTQSAIPRGRGQKLSRMWVHARHCPPNRSFATSPTDVSAARCREVCTVRSGNGGFPLILCVSPRCCTVPPFSGRLRNCSRADSAATRDAGLWRTRVAGVAQREPPNAVRAARVQGQRGAATCFAKPATARHALHPRSRPSGTAAKARHRRNHPHGEKARCEEQRDARGHEQPRAEPRATRVVNASASARHARWRGAEPLGFAAALERGRLALRAGARHIGSAMYLFSAFI